LTAVRDAALDTGNAPLARAAAPPGQLAQARPALVLGARVALISGAMLFVLVLAAQGLTARWARPDDSPALLRWVPRDAD
jgi:hypothetical protein